MKNCGKFASQIILLKKAKVKGAPHISVNPLSRAEGVDCGVFPQDGVGVKRRSRTSITGDRNVRTYMTTKFAPTTPPDSGKITHCHPPRTGRGLYRNISLCPSRLRGGMSRRDRGECAPHPTGTHPSSRKICALCKFIRDPLTPRIRFEVLPAPTGQRNPPNSSHNQQLNNHPNNSLHSTTQSATI